MKITTALWRLSTLFLWKSWTIFGSSSLLILIPLNFLLSCSFQTLYRRLFSNTPELWTACIITFISRRSLDIKKLSVTECQLLDWKEKTGSLNSPFTAISITWLLFISEYLQSKVAKWVIQLKLLSPKKSHICWVKTHAKFVYFIIANKRSVSLRIFSFLFMTYSKGRHWFSQLQKKIECVVA